MENKSPSPSPPTSPSTSPPTPSPPTSPPPSPSTVEEPTVLNDSGEDFTEQVTISGSNQRHSSSSLEEIDLNENENLNNETNEIKELVVDAVVDNVEEYVDESFSRLLSKLTDKLGNTPISSKTLLLIVKYAMELLEGERYTGSQKKQITINLVTSIVKESCLEDGKKELCLEVIDETLSDTIDLIVDASKGNININTLKKTSANCLSVLFSSICK